MTPPERGEVGRRDRGAPARGSQVAPPLLRIRLLGGFRVALGEREIAPAAWRVQKAKSLVKLLALAPGHRLAREQLLELLWPDLDPEAAANNLHRTLHAARRALDAGLPGPAATLLRLREGVLALAPPGPVWIDVDAFTAAAAAARGAGDPAAYHRALALYTGELLPEDRYEDWAADRREGLRETWLGLLLGVARLHEGRREWAEAIDALERAAAAEPAHEDAQVGLMRLYALAGQRGRALRQWARLQEGLWRELEAQPEPASQRLYAEILAGRFPPAAPAAAPASAPAPTPRRHNLPAPLTSFIGRAGELAELGALLSVARPGPRLLTLTGAGGCGKTRLALEVARTVAPAYPDGVWLAELSGLADPALVPGAAAAALGLRETPGRPPLDSLAEALHPKAPLLVLDNCEHLIDACAGLAATLLAACPRLRILATSREGLRVPGELPWRVPPLALPDARRAPSAEGLAGVEAVALLVERVRSRQPSFALTAANAPATAELCRRLDGLPLAIELAAARAGVLTIEQLAGRLDEALRLLTGGTRTAPSRHQTLRATLDWSYGLLSAAEQVVLRRLAPFAGSWALEAAEAVVAGQGAEGLAPDDVLPPLAGLVDKSLVQVEEGDAAIRYRLLETVRQYAAERLAASGEAGATRGRHAAHYLALAEEAEPALTGPEQGAWLERLAREHDNLRAALDWAVERGQPETEARLCAALWRFWYVRGHLVEGGRRLAGALARGDGDALPRHMRARLLQGTGILAVSRGDLARAEEALRPALALFREAGDRRGTAAALHILGIAAERQGDLEAAAGRYEESLRLREEENDTSGAAMTLQSLGSLARFRGDARQAAALYERSLALNRGLGSKRGVAIALSNLGNLASDERDYARAAALYQESLELLRALGDTASSAIVLKNLASTALARGDHRRAAALYAECLDLARGAGDQRGLALGLDGLAGAAAQRGDPPGARRAARLYGAAEALRAALGLAPEPNELAERAAPLAAARATLGEAAFAAAWAAGGALSPEEAVAEALASAPAVPPAPPHPA